MKSMVAIAAALLLFGVPAGLDASQASEGKWLISLLPRDSGFDAYWIITDWSIPNRPLRLLRTSFSASGTQQGPTSTIDNDNAVVWAVDGRWQSPLAVWSGGIALISGNRLEMREQFEPGGGARNLACGGSRCLLFWQPGLSFARWTDLDGNPVGSPFNVPPIAFLQSLVVSDRGALLVGVLAGQLHATMVGFDGKVVFDQVLAKGLLWSPAVAADDDGTRFVIAWVDSPYSPIYVGPSAASASALNQTDVTTVVHATSIAYDGTLTELPPLRSSTGSWPFGKLALACNGQTHLLALTEYPDPSTNANGALTLWSIDRNFARQPVQLGSFDTGPGFPVANVSAVSVAGGFAVSWQVGAPLIWDIVRDPIVVFVSSAGRISQPVRLEKAAARRRAIR